MSAIAIMEAVAAVNNKTLDGKDNSTSNNDENYRSMEAILFTIAMVAERSVEDYNNATLNSEENNGFMEPDRRTEGNHVHNEENGECSNAFLTELNTGRHWGLRLHFVDFNLGVQLCEIYTCPSRTLIVESTKHSHKPPEPSCRKCS